jgi:hypothetical protein
MKKLLMAATVACANTSVFAAEYECPVQEKIGIPGQVYSTEEISKWQFSVRIDDRGSSATISRCSFSSTAQSVTCDDYEADYIAHDTHVGHKKFYNFRGQFDIQLFSNLNFVENNGRGAVAFGTCRLVRP